MRKTVLSLMSVAALALAGCNNTSNSSTQVDAAKPAPASTASAVTKVSNEISGNISLRAGSPTPSDKATLVLNLVDVSASAAGSAPLASKTSPAGSFPQSFTLNFNPVEVKPNDLYVIQATLTDGERQYTMPIQAPVLAKGSNDAAVEIQLQAEQTPAEKLLADFAEVKAQIGGMKISHGTKLESNDSRGWQLFRQAGEVKYIREEVDYGDKGYTSTDYAYKNGKPWVIVQETKASRDGKPSAIDRAGWSDDGTLVLKQHQVGADVQPLDAATAATMKKGGVSILSIATGGKNK